MIIIQPLTELTASQLELIAGYTSEAIYTVEKSEHHEQTIISLRLTPLPFSYVKQFDPPDEYLLSHYHEVATKGFSFAAYEDEQAVGIALASVQAWNRSLWVWEFHIALSHQGRGIGRRLMDALAKKGKEAGLRTIICETQSTNIPAITFYRRVGFNIEGIDLSYYTNEDMEPGREVALFMKRRLE